MNNPIVYYYFYDRFFRSTVGEHRWRQSLKSANKSARMGSVQAEAFAMILLKNNYFAWLMEMKEKVPEGRTDYDTNTMTNAQDYKELNFHLNSEIDVEGETFKDTDYCILVDMEDYKDRQEESLTAQREVRKKAKKNKQYKAMLVHYVQECAMNAVMADPQDVSGDVERKKKRRKVLKTLRDYTAVKEDERRFRGWSVRAADDMGELVTKIVSEKERYSRFNAAYRFLHAKLNPECEKEKQAEAPLPEVDRSLLWGDDMLTEEV